MPAPSPELRDLLFWLQLLVQPGTIYRGESQCFDRVSSGLYRQLHSIDDDGFDIMGAQNRQLEEARNFSSLTSEADLLTTIQHLGGKTNLIDFTKDINIALFFAATYAPDQDGRVIFFNPHETLRQHGPDEFKIILKGTPSNMADVQKSVWIIPKSGYIAERDMTIVTIPRTLKQEITEHLKALYGVEQATVYNDISGFIRDQESFWDHDAELSAGSIAFNAQRYEEALQHFARCIELSRSGKWPKSLHAVHHLRALAYWQVGQVAKAVSEMEASKRWSPKMEGLPRIPELDALLDQVERDMNAEHARTAQPEADPGDQEVFGFHLRARDEEGAPQPVTFRVHHESGYGYTQTAGADGNLLIMIPNDCCRPLADSCCCGSPSTDAGAVHGLKAEWPIHRDGAAGELHGRSRRAGHDREQALPRPGAARSKRGATALGRR